jgi:hypothetical protein
VLGEFCEWNASDVNGVGCNWVDFHRLEWGWVHRDWDLRGCCDCGDVCNCYVQQWKQSGDDWNRAGQFFYCDDHAWKQRSVWVGAHCFAGDDRDGAADMHEPCFEHHLQYRAKFNHLDGESDQCGNRG